MYVSTVPESNPRRHVVQRLRCSVPATSSDPFHRSTSQPWDATRATSKITIVTIQTIEDDDGLVVAAG